MMHTRMADLLDTLYHRTLDGEYEWEADLRKNSFILMVVEDRYITLRKIVNTYYLNVRWPNGTLLDECSNETLKEEFRERWDVDAQEIMHDLFTYLRKDVLHVDKELDDILAYLGPMEDE